MIAADQPQHEFIFIGEKEFAEKTDAPKNIKWVVLSQQSGSPLLWKLWYNYKLPAVLKKYKADVLISGDGTCCLRTKLPQCLLVNDIAFHDHPEWHTKKYYRFIKTNTAAFLEKAKRIITFSGTLKDKITQQYKIEAHKISVIPFCTDAKYQPVNWEEREQVKMQYAEGKEYFLFSCAIHPRSNLTNLLKAFSLFKKRQKSNMQLVIVSGPASADSAFVESLKLYKYRNEIKLLENAGENLLQTLTASAYACVNISPLNTDIASLLNAMQAGVPVIAGNSTIAIEILEGAALYVDGAAPEDIAANLMLLYKDEEKRKDLIKKGVQRSAKLTLGSTAAQLWQIIEATIQQG